MSICLLMVPTCDRRTALPVAKSRYSIAECNITHTTKPNQSFSVIIPMQETEWFYSKKEIIATRVDTAQWQ